jgi:hypothetical protein
MAGQAASKTVPLGSASGPQRRTICVIQINAPAASVPNDRALPPGQPASLTAPEDMQP